MRRVADTNLTIVHILPPQGAPDGLSVTTVNTGDGQ